MVCTASWSLATSSVAEKPFDAAEGAQFIVHANNSPVVLRHGMATVVGTWIQALRLCIYKNLLQCAPEELAHALIPVAPSSNKAQFEELQRALQSNGQSGRTLRRQLVDIPPASRAPFVASLFAGSAHQQHFVDKMERWAADLSAVKTCDEESRTVSDLPGASALAAACAGQNSHKPAKGWGRVGAGCSLWRA